MQEKYVNLHERVKEIKDTPTSFEGWIPEDIIKKSKNRIIK